MNYEYDKHNNLSLKFMEECKYGNLDNVIKIIHDNPDFNFKDGIVIKKSFGRVDYISGRIIAQSHNHTHIVKYIDSIS